MLHARAIHEYGVGIGIHTDVMTEDAWELPVQWIHDVDLLDNDGVNTTQHLLGQHMRYYFSRWIFGHGID